MSKAKQRRRAWRTWIRDLVAEGTGFGADGLQRAEKVLGDGRGMFEQRMAGYRVGPYAKKGKKDEHDRLGVA